MTSQKKQVLEYLQNHRSITRSEAWHDLGISELPKRISELRQDGITIGDEWVYVVNRYGKRTRVKAYSLEQEAVA